MFHSRKRYLYKKQKKSIIGKNLRLDIVFGNFRNKKIKNNPTPVNVEKVLENLGEIIFEWPLGVATERLLSMGSSDWA